MKSLLIICILIFMGFSPAKSQTLVLHHADGTTTDVELYTKPHVKFQDNKVLITSVVLDMELPQEDVLTFTFKGGTLGINTPKANVNFSKENGLIIFHGIKSSEKIALYNTKGIRIPAKFQRQGDAATLSLQSISSGVYLLNVNGKTLKFTKP